MKSEKREYSCGELIELLFSKRYGFLLARLREDFHCRGVQPERIDAVIIDTLNYACKESIYVFGYAKNARGVLSLLEGWYKNGGR